MLAHERSKHHCKILILANIRHDWRQLGVFLLHPTKMVGVSKIPRFSLQHGTRYHRFVYQFMNPQLLSYELRALGLKVPLKVISNLADLQRVNGNDGHKVWYIEQREVLLDWHLWKFMAFTPNLKAYIY